MIDATERQVGTELGHIRADHRNRYVWAANRIRGGRVVDAGCGVGYGSAILAEIGCDVRAFDRDAETIKFAKRHWNHNPNIEYAQLDVYGVASNEEADAVVAFEVLEHLVEPERALRNFRTLAPKLYCSVPSEKGFPYRGYKHHVRHYTANDLRALLHSNGWEIEDWNIQRDKTSDVEPAVKDDFSVDEDGRTLVCVANRIEGWIEPEEEEHEPTPEEILGGPVPDSVAIVAMGGSRQAFFTETIQNGGPVADEIWAINAMAGLVKWDRMFHQDDIHIQELRREAGDERIGNMIDCIKNAEGPVYTSRVYPEYPTTVEFPLEWVINRIGNYYHNSTVAYAVTFAIAIGVKRIKLYGADFGYPTLFKREQGRGCVEFWLGVAASRGIEVLLPPGTTLMDQHVSPRERLYGYDTEWVTVQRVDNKLRVSRVERLPEDIPTAEEIELRYSKDPNKEKLATQKKEK